MQTVGCRVLATVGLPVVLVALVLPGTLEAQDAAYDKFRAALKSGDDCHRLFELRNAAKQTATEKQQEEMNAKLRSVGCFTSTSKRAPEAASKTGAFTVKEYRIYRTVIDTPMSVPESEAMKKVGAAQKMTETDVRKTVEKVQRILSKNNWYGSPEAEIRHASDWKGEKR